MSEENVMKAGWASSKAPSTEDFCDTHTLTWVAEKSEDGAEYHATLPSFFTMSPGGLGDVGECALLAGLQMLCMCPQTFDANAVHVPTDTKSRWFTRGRG
jgi:hypothetical protein